MNLLHDLFFLSERQLVTQRHTRNSPENTWLHNANESIKRMNTKQMKKGRAMLHPPFGTGIDQEYIRNRAEYALLTPINKSAPEAMFQSYK